MILKSKRNIQKELNKIFKSKEVKWNTLITIYIYIYIYIWKQNKIIFCILGHHNQEKISKNYRSRNKLE